MSDINLKLSLGDVIHEGIDKDVCKSYTMADILMGCRKIAENLSDNDVATLIDKLVDIHDRITDILVCAGLVNEDGRND